MSNMLHLLQDYALASYVIEGYMCIRTAVLNYMGQSKYNSDFPRFAIRHVIVNVPCYAIQTVTVLQKRLIIIRN